jgi:cell division GTPase FtsZ
MLAPTLIVGLGGKGSDIVNRVSKLASAEQKKRISFVIFDTDVNELNQIRFKNDKIKAIQTSTKMTVGEYLNIDTNARDNWFPVNKILSRKTLTEGAGQVRAISRLALETSIRAGSMEPLHKAIDELFKLDTEKTEQALRVIIVSSLAGGTGSGLILPVSMYIKNYLDTHFQQSATIIRGFFILPEVFFEVIHGLAERNNLNCNAYATLRELDALLMNGDGTLP